MDFVNRGDVGMMKAGERRRLGLKEFHELAVGELRIQHFHRDLTIQRFIERFIHDAQRSPAELLDESVFTDGFSDHVALLSRWMSNGENRNSMPRRKHLSTRDRDARTLS